MNSAVLSNFLGVRMMIWQMSSWISGNSSTTLKSLGKVTDVMVFRHHMNTLILENKLFLAPIGKDIQKVLDIGTGTGIWAM